MLCACPMQYSFWEKSNAKYASINNFGIYVSSTSNSRDTMGEDGLKMTIFMVWTYTLFAVLLITMLDPFITICGFSLRTVLREKLHIVIDLATL